MMPRYTQAWDGEWFRPIHTGYRIQCCDCGLVHRELHVPDPDCPTRLHVYSWRDEEATAAARTKRSEDLSL